MTTLQEAARDALEALERIGKDFVCRSAHHAKKDQHSAFAECPVVVRHTDAIESLRTALAQQGERKNCPQPEICGSKECEFCRDTAAPAPQAQPTSGDYALGYAEGFNDACKPAPQPAQGNS